MSKVWQSEITRKWWWAVETTKGFLLEQGSTDSREQAERNARAYVKANQGKVYA